VPFLVIGAGGLAANWLWSRRRERKDEADGDGPKGDDLDPEVEAKIRRRLQEYL